jgi:hypothetical protein
MGKARAQDVEQKHRASRADNQRRNTPAILKTSEPLFSYSTLSAATLSISAVGTNPHSSTRLSSEEQLRVWIEMEESEPTGYVAYERFSSVTMRI